MTIIINSANWEAGLGFMTLVTWSLCIGVALYVYLGDRNYIQSKKRGIK